MDGARRLHPALPLGGPSTWTRGTAALVWQVRMVLETRPGQLPWRPEFGCDLDGLAGKPATDAHLRQARLRIESALSRWVPGVRILQLRVGLRSAVGAGALHDRRQVPVAEAALLRLGTQAELAVDLVLAGPDGRVDLTALLSP